METLTRDENGEIYPLPEYKIYNETLRKEGLRMPNPAYSIFNEEEDINNLKKLGRYISSEKPIPADYFEKGWREYYSISLDKINPKWIFKGYIKIFNHKNFNSKVVENSTKRNNNINNTFENPFYHPEYAEYHRVLSKDNLRMPNPGHNLANELESLLRLKKAGRYLGPEEECPKENGWVTYYTLRDNDTKNEKQWIFHGYIHVYKNIVYENITPANDCETEEPYIFAKYAEYDIILRKEGFRMPNPGYSLIAEMGDILKLQLAKRYRGLKEGKPNEDGWVDYYSFRENARTKEKHAVLQGFIKIFNSSDVTDSALSGPTSNARTRTSITTSQSGKKIRFSEMPQIKDNYDKSSRIMLRSNGPFKTKDCCLCCFFNWCKKYIRSK